MTDACLPPDGMSVVKCKECENHHQGAIKIIYKKYIINGEDSDEKKYGRRQTETYYIQVMINNPRVYDWKIKQK